MLLHYRKARRTWENLLLGSLLIISGMSALPAQTSIQTERLTTQDGLANHWIYGIMQDSRGYMWFSTYDGLQRYDGNTFKVYRPSESVDYQVTDQIQWTLESEDGTFIVSGGNGLMRFDPGDASFDSLFNGQTYRHLFRFRTAEGEVWRMQNRSSLETNPQHLFVYRDTAATWVKEFGFSKPSRMDMALARTDADAFWFWSYSGTYYRVDRKTREVAEFPVDGAPALIPIDGSGKCWYVRDDGKTLGTFDLPGNRDDWSSAVFDEKGIWLFRRGALQSIFWFDYAHARLEEIATGAGLEIDNDGEDFVVYDICEDREGNLWLAHFQGVLKIERRKQLFETYLNKPIPAGGLPPVAFSARSLAETEDGTLYVQENGSLVYRIDRSTGSGSPLTFRSHPDWGGGAVSMTSMGNTLWLLATHRNGLIKVDSETGEYQYYQTPREFNTSGAKLVKGTDRIWIAGAHRLMYFDPATETFGKAGDISGDFLYSDFSDDSSVIWAVEGENLLKVNPISWTAESIRIFDYGREVRCIAPIGENVWIGTSRGLLRVNTENYAVKRYSTAQGLPGAFIYSMVADGDMIWLGTSDGLSQFNTKTESFRNFLLADGLPHYEFNSNSTLKSETGKIYMGTLNGIIGFDPASLEVSDNERPGMLWSGFRYLVKGSDSLRAYRPGQLQTEHPIVLSPCVRNFTIDLAITSYASPRQNQYAWRMDGLDDTWNYMGNQSSVVYHQLPPGHYTFHAKGADPSGHWSENELIIPFVVLSPWYARWWAYCIYFLVFAGIILWVYRFQLGRKLQQAENARLRELDSFKSRFFANITHEFRTPLTVILGSAERAQQAASPEVAGSLKIIHRNGQSLLRLINQILDLTRLENRKLEMQYVQGDVLAYVRYLAESLHSLANTRNVLVRVESDESKIVMDYDPERLLYIIQNLLSNAIKFTGSGGKVRMQVNYASRDTLRIVVSDTGIGISVTDLPRIFDRFYQVQGNDRPQTGGSGIGLALTKELVNAMQGDIHVESEPGKGTTFTVLLPIHHDAPLQDEQEYVPVTQELPKETYAIEAREGDKPDLLVIEDNPDVVEYLQAALEKLYTIRFAYNGRAGIEAALEYVPDLIISDVMMPEKDGFEVLGVLKNDERTSHIPIILLTARAEIESRIAGLRRGADAYLSKPFHQEELEVTLQRLLETRRRLRERYRQPEVSEEIVPEEVDVVMEDAFVSRVREFFEENLAHAELNLEDTCKAIGMNRTNLTQKLKALTGRSPMQLLQEMRLDRAKELLLQGELNVSEVAFEVGFNDPKYFSRAFSKTFGHPPSQVS